jgi:hypothetical protein
MEMKSASLFWKAFFFVWPVYAVFVFLITGQTSWASVENVYLLALLAIGGVALFGLAFQKRIAWLWWWRAFFVFQLGVALITLAVLGSVVVEVGFRDTLFVLFGGEGIYAAIIFPLLTLIQIVYIYGLYRYAFASSEIWGPAQAKKSRKTK